MSLFCCLLQESRIFRFNFFYLHVTVEPCLFICFVFSWCFCVYLYVTIELCRAIYLNQCFKRLPEDSFYTTCSTKFNKCYVTAIDFLDELTTFYCLFSFSFLLIPRRGDFLMSLFPSCVCTDYKLIKF